MATHPEAVRRESGGGQRIMLFMGTVGYGRNRAIQQSTGNYLCFFDAVRRNLTCEEWLIIECFALTKDDVMAPQRIELQYAAATTSPDNMVRTSCATLARKRSHLDIEIENPVHAQILDN